MNEVPLPLWAEMLIAALVLGGATIALLGSLGLLRLKSYFERVHAPSIIATMGCWLIMWATFVFFTATGQGLALHALLIAVFIAVTVPITTIFLMRAALFRARRAGRDVPPSVSRIVPNEPQQAETEEAKKN
jgi:multicomponent K+:H+ antiporter subunit G